MVAPTAVAEAATQRVRSRRSGAWWRRGRIALPFVIALVVYWAAYGEMNNTAIVGDEPGYVLESWSLVDDFDRNLANQYRAYFPPIKWDLYTYTSPDKYLRPENVGLAVALIPVALFDRHQRINAPGWSLGTKNLSNAHAYHYEMVVISAIAAFLLFLLLDRLRLGPRWLRSAVWAVTVFSLPLVAYSNQIYPEMLAAAVLLAGLHAVVAPRPGYGRLLWGGLAAAALPWLHVRYMVLAAGLAAAVCWRALEPRWRRPIAGGARRVAAVLAAGAGPLVVSLLAMSVAFHAWYGSFGPDAPYNAPGQAGPHTNLHTLYANTMRQLLSPQEGWLPIAPVGLLALAGAVYLCWRYRGWAIAGVLVVAAYLAATTTSGGVGYAFPARFLIPVLPLAAIPLLAVVADVKPARMAFWPLAAISLVLTYEGVTHAQLLYPPEPNMAGGPVHLWLATHLRHLWPTLAPNGPGDNYPDAAFCIAWLIALAFVGWLFVRARDDVQRGRLEAP